MKNIGFAEGSTHTVENKTDRKDYNTFVRAMRFPLRHPSEVSLNKELCKKYICKEIKRIILKSIS